MADMAPNPPGTSLALHKQSVPLPAPCLISP